MEKIKNNNASPTKDTGTKNNNSDNDVDYKNGSRTSNKVNSNTSNKSDNRGSK
jgi:hypothetical protein